MVASAVLIAVAFSSVFAETRGDHSIGDLSWMSGCWHNAGDALAEEYWMRPDGGTMIGMSRTKEDGRIGFETWSLREEDGRIRGTAWINATRRSDFISVKVTPGKMVLESPELNPPTRLTYEKTGPDSMLARLEKQAGSTRKTFEFKFKRAACDSMLPPNRQKEKTMATETLAKDRIIRKEAIVHAPLRQVWEAWTTSKGAETFFAPKANIELKGGGAYEIYFDPTDERMGTKGLKLLNYIPLEMVSFQWNAPPNLPEVRDNPIWVVVQLEEAAGGTRVRLTHAGWKEGKEWDQAFEYFNRAWDVVMGRLRRRFDHGPIDWSKQG